MKLDKINSILQKGVSDVLEGATSIRFSGGNSQTPFSDTVALKKDKILLESLAQICNMKKHLVFYWTSTCVPSPFPLIQFTSLRACIVEIV